jgi:hypothetical protein
MRVRIRAAPITLKSLKIFLRAPIAKALAFRIVFAPIVDFMQDVR